MAPPLRRRGGGSFRWLWRRIYGLLIVSIGICIVTKLLFMSIKNPSVHCPSCYCDCSYQDFLPISCQFINYNNSITGSDGVSRENSQNAQMDVEMIEEVQKDRSTLIKEEIDLVRIVSDENMQRYKSLMEIAMKSSSQYQKEADSCNLGVRTCEEARERAQEQLVQEYKLTALWQKRAQMLATP